MITLALRLSRLDNNYARSLWLHLYDDYACSLLSWSNDDSALPTLMPHLNDINACSLFFHLHNYSDCSLLSHLNNNNACSLLSHLDNDSACSLLSHLDDHGDIPSSSTGKPSGAVLTVCWPCWPSVDHVWNVDWVLTMFRQSVGHLPPVGCQLGLSSTCTFFVGTALISDFRLSICDKEARDDERDGV